MHSVEELDYAFARFGIGGEKSSKYTFSADERFMQPGAEGTDT